MNHILERIADYLENRLAPDERREFEVHRDECNDCAAAVAFAMKLQAEAMAQGLVHIRPERIVALSADRNAATREESQHLDACESCRRELEWAASGTDEEAAGEEPDAEIRRRAARSFARRWWPAGAVVLAAVIATLIFLPRGPRDAGDTGGIMRIEPLPVNISRGLVEEGTFDAARLRALVLYRDADYAGARAAFEEALALRDGDAEMLLYLGSTELLQGSPARAAAHLEAAAGAPGAAPALREEALWQLAHAHLAADRRQDATATLEEVAALDGRHADNARRLLAELRP
jgi:tetratricopeptide (TPR) repeat protein